MDPPLTDEEIIRRMDPSDVLRRMAEVQRVLEVLEVLGMTEEVWDRKRAFSTPGEAGGDAPIARFVFRTDPEVMLVVISYDFAMERGMELSTEDHPVVWFRKASVLKFNGTCRSYVFAPSKGGDP